MVRSLSDFSEIEPSNFLCVMNVIKIKIEASIRLNCVSSSDPRPSSQPPEREKQKISFQTGIMS